MTRHGTIIGLLSIMAVAFAVVSPVRGQESSAGLDPCAAAFRAAIGKEERYFRTVIYGQQSASEARSGAVRYDAEGSAWLKIAPNSWRSLSPGFEQIQWSDAQMAAQSEHPDRQGLVEIRSALTSEVFIEPALQSLRALRCRLAAVCMAAEQSEYATEDTVDVQPIGCIEMTMPTFPECVFAGRAPEYARIATLSSCAVDRTTTLSLEADLLRMTGAYDAAYRSLLQFAGSFEGFIDDVRDPLLQPMRRAIDMFLELRQLPCFISECNA